MASKGRVSALHKSICLGLEVCLCLLISLQQPLSGYRRRSLRTSGPRGPRPTNTALKKHRSREKSVKRLRHRLWKGRFHHLKTALRSDMAPASAVSASAKTPKNHMRNSSISSSNTQERVASGVTCFRSSLNISFPKEVPKNQS